MPALRLAEGGAGGLDEGGHGGLVLFPGGSFHPAGGIYRRWMHGPNGIRYISWCKPTCKNYRRPIQPGCCTH